MNYDEALTITRMVVTSWPSGKAWTAEEMEAYANGLLKYEPETMTQAVAAAQQKLMYRPSVAELSEFYDIAAAARRAAAPAPAQPDDYKRGLPQWVKAWVVARHRHNDFRVLPDQKPGYDSLQTDNPGFRTYVWPDQQPMPPEQAAAYALEGAALTVDDVFATIQQ